MGLIPDAAFTEQLMNEPDKSTPRAFWPLHSPWLRNPARALHAWRARRRVSPAWGAFAVALAALMLLPVAMVAVLALSAGDNIWPHLLHTVLPASLRDTVLLLAGVGVLVLAMGTGAAWLTTMYRFPGRSLLDRMLVLPLAMPTYIAAYCYVEVMDYSGPVQSALRSAFGWRSAREYWFPEIRSLWGAVLILSLVLYPYVYLAARATFVQQSVCMLEVARTLGRTAAGTFWAVALPLARPALAAGVALVLMECLNDLGAVQYLGVQTLSASIYATWQQRGSLAGAAQISMVALGFVTVLVLAERFWRGRSQYHNMTGRFRAIPFAELAPARGIAAALLCAIPVLLGFVVPFLVLLSQGLTHVAEVMEADFWRAAFNSVRVAATAALVTVGLGLALAYAGRIAPTRLVRPLVRMAGLGYALPGTVLALGLLYALSAVDNTIDSLMRSVFGISTGLMLSGSVLVVVLAYTVRFLAISLSTFEAGFARLSPNLDAAARTLGETGLSALRRVHLPLLVPALGAAALIVFVDGMKELSATLLLRPFNFETLATHVYSYASLELFERSALGALTIVLIGLLPVLLLHEAVAGGRSGGTDAPRWFAWGRDLVIAIKSRRRR